MDSNWKIYTKQGDKGQTSLLGGSKVPKFHERIEAYGTLDELNSFIGLVRDYSEDEKTRDFLKTIQDDVFAIESHLAAETEEVMSYLPEVTGEHIHAMEQEIDRMESTLPTLKNFILPGGHPAVSYCHIARTVCRRAERTTIRLGERIQLDEIIIQYLNRLSDYFFVLARYLGKHFNAEEIIWKPKS